MAISAAVLHGALGLGRPIARTYLSFAFIMACLAPHLYFELELYRVTTPEAAVAAVRYQLFCMFGVFAGVLVFIPAYTRVRLPRLVVAAYWSGLALLFVANLWAPYGVWLSGPPTLVRSTFRGEPYTGMIVPPMGPLQVALVLYYTSYLVIAFGCAVSMYRRGARQAGLALAVALVLVFAFAVVDVVRDSVGGAWPYVSEFGLVSWGVVMSVQLAFAVRAQAEAVVRAVERIEAQRVQLCAILAALRTLDHDLDRPLRTLEQGLAALPAGGPGQGDPLGRERRAVTRLGELRRTWRLAPSPSEC